MGEKLLLTGHPGAGKSTAIEDLKQKYPGRLRGVVAREIREKGERLGFSAGPLENPTLVIIAHKAINSDVNVGEYGVSVESLDTIANVLSQERLAASTSDMILVFDEIGLMQSASEKLRNQIETALEADGPAIFTIRHEDDDSEWLKNIKKKTDTKLISITAETREEIFDELSRYIEENS